MKNFNLKLNFEKLLKTKKYYIKYNRNKKISYKNYFSNPVDPNGKKRNLFKEEKYRLSQLKVITKFLNKDLIKKKKENT